MAASRAGAYGTAMDPNRYDAVILGAGPAGLTAAYCLAKRGARALLVERTPHVGGLMRGIRRGAFQVDLGRRDLHSSRFPEVHALWQELLGDDLRPYKRRVGVLHGGRVLEKYSDFRGRLRGMSVRQAAAMAASAFWSQVKPGSRAVGSLEDFYTLRYGRAYYDCFIRGYVQKFDGRDPGSMPAPDGTARMTRFARLRERLAGHGGDEQPIACAGAHHPALGSQQIADALWQGARAGGVELAGESEALAIDASGGRIRGVTLRSRNGAVRAVQTRHAIVSLPMPVMFKLLGTGVPELLATPPKHERAFLKSTALVYLFAEGEPRFAHNWLEVTDPDLRMARVVNYASWRGRMVPEGKTALCVEFFDAVDGEIARLPKEALLELALSECSANGLIDRAGLFDSLVLQMPATNATTTFSDWLTPWMLEARSHARAIEGLLETNRPGMDRACLAGMEAAEACLTGRPMGERSLDDTELAPGQAGGGLGERADAAQRPPYVRHAFGR